MVRTVYSALVSGMVVVAAIAGCSGSKSPSAEERLVSMCGTVAPTGSTGGGTLVDTNGALVTSAARAAEALQAAGLSPDPWDVQPSDEPVVWCVFRTGATFVDAKGHRSVAPRAPCPPLVGTGPVTCGTNVNGYTTIKP